MQPTKCYRVAGYAITNSIQLEYLKRYFTHMINYFIHLYLQKEESSDDSFGINRYTEKLQQVKKAMSEGLHYQPLIKQEEIYEPYTHYPDVVVELEDGMYYFQGKEPRLFKAKGFYKKIDEMPKKFPSFKLSSITNIEIEDITDESEKGYHDKKIYISAETVSDEKRFTYTFILSLKEDQYICVDKVYNREGGLVSNYMVFTQSFQRMFLQQFFERRIDLALSGNGGLMKYKDLPIITLPKTIKE